MLPGSGLLVGRAPELGHHTDGDNVRLVVLCVRA